MGLLNFEGENSGCFFFQMGLNDELRGVVAESLRLKEREREGKK